MYKKLYLSLIIFIVAALAVQAQVMTDEDIDDGAYILTIAGCISCHDIGGHNPKSNMIPIATNVISEELFEQILRQGRNAGGNKMRAVMPFEHYALMTDEDVHKLYAFYVSIRDSQRQVTASALPQGERFKPEEGKSEAYNRGSYLVNALGYCGACHAPDGGMALSGGIMSEKWDIYDKTGTKLKGKNWVAYNISSDPVSGVGAWSNQELHDSLTKGSSHTKGSAGGIMGSVVVQNSLRMIYDEDIEAIIVYLKTAQPLPGNESKARYKNGTPVSMETVNRLRSTGMAEVGAGKELSGEVLYNTLCATCHGWDGTGGNEGDYPPSLIYNSTVGASGTNNMILTILQGISRKDGAVDVFMPAFARKLTDKEISALGTYLARQFGNPSVSIAEKDVKRLR